MKQFDSSKYRCSEQDQFNNTPCLNCSRKLGEHIMLFCPKVVRFDCCQAYGSPNPEHQCESHKMGYNEAITPEK